MKTKINVNEYDREKAISMGAIYEEETDSFYVPNDLKISDFTEFIILPIELIPSSNFNKNVRSEFGEQWDGIRRSVYAHANYRCQICGGRGPAHPVECHEKWSYDMKSGIQKLEDLVALCPDCHKTQHWGFALISGLEDVVRKQIKETNEWTDQDLDKYLIEVFDIFDIRSSRQWTLDMSLLKEY